MDKIEEILTRGVENVLPDKSGLAKLMAGKKIRVYLGIDPTGPNLHLGHTIPLRKLQQFADLGHEAILLFGTGTVLAGDPSQRKEARKAITQEEINENIKTWKIQAAKVVDLEKIQIKQNGDWLLKLSVPEVINIASKISAIQLFKREMFQKRMEAEETVWTHELLYPLLQGYDSVHMDVDAEIGGTDQTFNMLIGRELQKKMKNREKFVLTTPLILGTDGQTMSKSSGNCIWLDDTAEEMTRKIMSIGDKQIEEYWNNLTNLPQGDFKKADSIAAKRMLAVELVKTYHGASASVKAETSAQLLKEYTQQSLSPQSLISLPTVTIPQGGTTVLDLATQIQSAGSISYVKDLVRQGAIDVDFKKVQSLDKVVRGDQIVRIGKKNIFKLEEEK